MMELAPDIFENCIFFQTNEYFSDILCEQGIDKNIYINKLYNSLVCLKGRVFKVPKLGHFSEGQWFVITPAFKTMDSMEKAIYKAEILPALQQSGILLGEPIWAKSISEEKRLNWRIKLYELFEPKNDLTWAALRVQPAFTSTSHYRY